jgi:hypothetical protein
MIWSWDRPEDLSSLSQSAPSVGVAYLAATATVSEARVHVARRANALRIGDATPRLPLVRIEIAPGAQPGEPELAPLVEAVKQASAGGPVQIDCEAAFSQRDFYRRLLREVRAALGPKVPISVTALSSWCLGDRWMTGRPVDEIVPMFYRLGSEKNALRADLAAGQDFAPECRSALGFITDEPFVAPPTARRAYVFSPHRWQPDQISAVLRKLKEEPL